MIALEPVASLPILLASLLGSAHCGGMCGGFVSLYAHQANRTGLSHLLYNLGRLFTYVILGTIAGALGEAIDTRIPIARISALTVGGVLVVIGAMQLKDLFTKSSQQHALPLSSFPLYQGLYRSLGGRLKSLFHSSSRTKPFLIGALTTLLPCGWLYAFIALALAAADPATALGIMVLFWLGTLPLMVGIGIASKTATGALAKRRPLLTALLLILGGALSMALHLLPSSTLGGSESYCHSVEAPQ